MLFDLVVPGLTSYYGRLTDEWLVVVVVVAKVAVVVSCGISRY